MSTGDQYDQPYYKTMAEDIAAQRDETHRLLAAGQDTDCAATSAALGGRVAVCSCGLDVYLAGGAGADIST